MTATSIPLSLLTDLTNQSPPRSTAWKSPDGGFTLDASSVAHHTSSDLEDVGFADDSGHHALRSILFAGKRWSAFHDGMPCDWYALRHGGKALAAISINHASRIAYIHTADQPELDTPFLPELCRALTLLSELHGVTDIGKLPKIDQPDTVLTVEGVLKPAHDVAISDILRGNVTLAAVSSLERRQALLSCPRLAVDVDGLSDGELADLPAEIDALLSFSGHSPRVLPNVTRLGGLILAGKAAVHAPKLAALTQLHLKSDGLMPNLPLITAVHRFETGELPHLGGIGKIRHIDILTLKSRAAFLPISTCRYLYARCHLDLQLPLLRASTYLRAPNLPLIYLPRLEELVVADLDEAKCVVMPKLTTSVHLTADRAQHIVTPEGYAFANPRGLRLRKPRAARTDVSDSMSDAERHITRPPHAIVIPQRLRAST